LNFLNENKENEVGKMNFEIRLHCISKEIIFARDEATKQGLINKQIEPFSIRQKQFFPISGTKKVIQSVHFLVLNIFE
jgi:hypothetical protein